ncbi:hypothetical protein [Marinoscillum sp. MHG1-6]|uniref:hypothetical protein n=1 Tax=Marinoscillum sp. MHG1-6 TaxID=2959627 RepID=UPI0021578A89|nr:hypothetical protein [Marinoscillum sp. MHG1-6]
MNAPRIQTNLSLRQVLSEDFQEYPIKGGWGYTMEDVIIIDKNDPINTSQIFRGIQIEKSIVEKRIHEELIIFRPKGDRYMNIDWKMIKQNLYMKDDLVYDELIYQVTAFSSLEPYSFSGGGQTFWFEISSFY